MDVPAGVATGFVLLGLATLLLVGLVVFSKSEDPSRRLRLLIREVLSGRRCRHGAARRTFRPARSASRGRRGAAGAA
jgi:hypothetical protein